MKEIEQKLKAYFQMQASQHRDDTNTIHHSMEKTILMAEQQLQNRQKVKTVGYGSFILEQIRMTGIWIWTLQIGIVLIAYLFLYLMTDMEIKYLSVKQVAFLTGILGVLMFSMAIPFLYRAQRYKMLEIEFGGKYSVGKVVLSRILILAIGDCLMLFGFVWQISQISPLSVFQTTVYLNLPFLMAVNGGIYLLRKVAFLHFQKWAYGMCAAICGMLLGVLLFYPAYYEMKFEVFTGAVLFLLTGCAIYQCTALWRGNGQIVYES